MLAGECTKVWCSSDVTKADCPKVGWAATSVFETCAKWSSSQGKTLEKPYHWVVSH